MNYSNHVYLHSYCSSFIIILLIFSLSCLYWSVFLIFSLSCLCFFFPSLSLLIHSLLQWVWSTCSFLIHSLLVLFVGVDFGLNGSNQPSLRSTLGFCLNGSRFQLDLGFGSNQPWEWETKKSQSLGLRDLGFCLMVAGWWWRWLVLRERERERGHEWENNKNVKEWIFYWINV